MAESSLLSWIVFLPAIGAAALLLPGTAEGQKRTALAFTVLTFALTLLLPAPFLAGLHTDAGSAYGEVFFAQRFDWIATAGGNFRVEYFLGVDGLSMPMVILTALISMLAIIASWSFERWNTRGGLRAYLMLLLILETGMLGTFVALDFVLFYVFWEVVLVPMYFLIGVWGGPRKEYAALKFFLFTLAGSVFMLVAMLAFYFQPAAELRTFDLLKLAAPALRETFQHAAFLGVPFDVAMFALLLVAFAVKLPIVPLHTWLPDAHVEAPTPVSMILAGVLLKMGGYGLLRISYPILPHAAAAFAGVLGALGVIAILYGALCAMAQNDFKRLVAYSSISHMGYVVLGLAAMNQAGFDGALFQMIAHGISSPMCFFLVGVLYDRTQHRDIDRFGGIAMTMPRYSVFASVGFLAALGLPALCGFVGEFLAVLAAFDSPALAARGYATTFGVLAASGAILTAGYILWMMKRVYLGPPRPEFADLPDADRRETWVLAPLALLCVALGVLPKPLLLDWASPTMRMILDAMGK
jgi:NADH-quinone oxidoreductase subunit M